MLTKLDIALVVACLASGAMALENHGRIDITPDQGPKVAAITCYMEPRALGPDWFDPSLSPWAFDALAPQAALVCRPA
jgi:hypothetical protein